MLGYVPLAVIILWFSCLLIHLNFFNLDFYFVYRMKRFYLFFKKIQPRVSQLIYLSLAKLPGVGEKIPVRNHLKSVTIASKIAK